MASHGGMMMPMSLQIVCVLIVILHQGLACTHPRCHKTTTKQFYPSCRNFTAPPDCAVVSGSSDCGVVPCSEGFECCIGPCGNRQCQKVYPSCLSTDPPMNPCGRPSGPMNCDYTICSERSSCCNDECDIGRCI